MLAHGELELGPKKAKDLWASALSTRSLDHIFFAAIHSLQVGWPVCRILHVKQNGVPRRNTRGLAANENDF